MAEAVYDLDVDWSGNTDFTGTGENLDMTRVRSIECTRGRNNSSQLTGKSVASRFKAVLDNRSGDYSSFNTSSPIAGSVLPNRVIRLRGTSAGQSDKAIWRGFLTRLQPVPRLGGGDNIAILEGVGPLGQINQEKISLAMRTSETTDVTMGALLDETQFPVGDRSFDTGKTSIVRFWADRVFPLTPMRQLEAIEGGFLFEGADGKLVFKNRHGRLAGDALTSQATFSDAGGAARPYSGLSQVDSLENIFNAFEAEVQLYTTATIATLWTLAEVGSSAPSISPGNSFTWFARFPNPASATNAFGVDVWTTPVTVTDFNFNSQAGGGGTDVTSDMAVVATKFGNTMKLVFTNNNATLPAFVQDLKARGTGITADDPIFIREEDNTSQLEYGDRTWPLRSQWMPSSQEGADWAKFHLGIYKDPIPHLRMSYFANRDENMLDEMLLREIGDRVTVVANNDAGLGLSSDFFIEQIKHRITNSGKLHQVTYLLSDAEQFSDFWVLDTSELDTQTRLAY